MHTYKRRRSPSRRRRNSKCVVRNIRPKYNVRGKCTVSLHAKGFSHGEWRATIKTSNHGARCLRHCSVARAFSPPPPQHTISLYCMLHYSLGSLTTDSEVGIRWPHYACKLQKRRIKFSAMEESSSVFKFNRRLFTTFFWYSTTIWHVKNLFQVNWRFDSHSHT